MSCALEALAFWHSFQGPSAKTELTRSLGPLERGKASRPTLSLGTQRAMAPLRPWRQMCVRSVAVSVYRNRVSSSAVCEECQELGLLPTYS